MHLSIYLSEYIWLHIRGVGEWTNRLYEWFEEEHERLHSGEEAVVGTNGTKGAIKKFKG